MFFDGDQVKPPCGYYVFKEKRFTLSDMDYDETQLIHFEMFSNDELTELISEQRNIYSSQKLGKTIKVTKEKILRFIGIQMYMSILKLPAYNLYLSKEMCYAQYQLQIIP